MTDFQNWWDGYFHEINGQKETAQAAWQARGELDAVRIKELTAKLDAAKDFFKTMENNTYSFVSVYQMLSKNALEELDK